MSHIEPIQTTKNRFFELSLAAAFAALTATVLMAAPRTLDPWIQQLTAVDAHDRAMAACEIGELRSTDISRAAPALLAMLADDTPVEGRLCRDWPNSGRWQARPEPGINWPEDIVRC